MPREGASAFIMNQPATKEEKDRVSQTDESHNQAREQSQRIWLWSYKNKKSAMGFNV